MLFVYVCCQTNFKCIAVKKLVRDTVRDTLNALEKKLLEYGVNDEDAVKEEIKRLFEEYMAVRDEVMLVAEVGKS